MKKTIGKKRNPYLSKQSAKLLLELKAKPKHMIIVCKKCGQIYKDYVDPRLSDNLCQECSPLYQRVKKEKKKTNEMALKTDWWTDFVTYFIAGDFSKPWIDPDQRRKNQNVSRH